jgi:hypothetical protein
MRLVRGAETATWSPFLGLAGTSGGQVRIQDARHWRIAQIADADQMKRVDPELAVDAAVGHGTVADRTRPEVLHALDAVPATVRDADQPNVRVFEVRLERAVQERRHSVPVPVPGDHGELIKSSSILHAVPREWNDPMPGREGRTGLRAGKPTCLTLRKASILAPVNGRSFLELPCVAPGAPIERDPARPTEVVFSAYVSCLGQSGRRTQRVPDFWTFSMEAGAYGTVQAGSPTSTATAPISRTVFMARAKNGWT